MIDFLCPVHHSAPQQMSGCLPVVRKSNQSSLSRVTVPRSKSPTPLCRRGCRIPVLRLNHCPCGHWPNCYLSVEIAHLRSNRCRFQFTAVGSLPDGHIPLRRPFSAVRLQRLFCERRPASQIAAAESLPDGHIPLKSAISPLLAAALWPCPVPLILARGWGPRPLAPGSGPRYQILSHFARVSRLRRGPAGR